MKNRCAIALTFLLFLPLDLLDATSDPYQLALPGYQYEFPRDYFEHPAFQTEWWYYTGNVHTARGRRFGFELTFFRHAINRNAPSTGIWDVRDVWMAHLALSDIDGKHFFQSERFNRAGAGTAGADLTSATVWNGNWETRWQLDRRAPGGVASQTLRAVADRFSFELSLRPVKPAVIHGIGGVSQKGSKPGQASHYISMTRLVTQGVITLEGTKFEVDGLSWMDHEFFTHQLQPEQAGWDWAGLQFEDGSEMMLFRIRRKDGTIDPHSSGTYVDSHGQTVHLSISDFSMVPGKTWLSPATGGHYPIEWSLRVPSLHLQVAMRTPLEQQELTGATRAAPTYWEGAVECSGLSNNREVKAVGYLEMTGYAGIVPLAE